MSEYEAFLAKKLIRATPVGIDMDVDSAHLFPFQRDLVRWSLKRGRAAIFASTGLGKTRQQLTWAKHVTAHTGKPTLVLAPLAVAAQTVREGTAIGIVATLCRSQEDARDGINVTNYDRLHLFDTSSFGAIVLDESSCLKDFTSSTRNQLVELFAATPFKLACSATPAPNDYTELGNHAEFLDIMTRSEMLSQWFVHDGGSTQDWRLKGHAVSDFWRWVCSWAALVRMPSDLGYDDGAYLLPELIMHEHVVKADAKQALATGKLFVEPAQGLDEQRKARRASISARVEACAAIIAQEPKEPWLIWGELNDECDALKEAIKDAVQVAGSDDRNIKEMRILNFAEGRTRILISKPGICGHGLNLQRCARIAFVGVSHSFEQTYQAIRRCWRYGQTRPVHVHVVIGEADGNVLESLRRKERDAERMADEMSIYTRDVVRAEVRRASRQGDAYKPEMAMKIPRWLRGEEAA